MALAGVVGRGSSLLASPLLTRLLGPEPYGIVSLVWTVISLATTLSVQIIEAPYLRYCAATRNDRAAAIERLCWRTAAGSTITFGILAAAVWALTLATGTGLPRSLSLAVAVGVGLTSLQTMAQARGRLTAGYERIAMSMTLSGIIGPIASIALAVYWRPDAWALLFGTLVGMLSGIMLLGIPSVRVLSTSSGLASSGRLSILRFGFSGLVTGPLHWVINSSDRWFLGIYKSREELGLYTFASSIALTGLIVNSSLAFTWFPEIAATHTHNIENTREQLGREWARLVVVLLLTWLAIVASGGDVIRLCADRRFHAGAQYVPWIAGGATFSGVASLAATGLFVAERMEPLASWWLLGAFCDVVLNALLVPTMGAHGSAIAYCASYGLIAAGIFWSSSKRYPIVIPWRRLGFVVIIVATASVLLIPPWHARPLLSLLAKLPAGIAVALAALYAVAPEWVIRGFTMTVGHGTNR
jgi:O-antigen/teichoic acid export membrane protein